MSALVATTAAALAAGAIGIAAAWVPFLTVSGLKPKKRYGDQSALLVYFPGMVLAVLNAIMVLSNSNNSNVGFKALLVQSFDSTVLLYVNGFTALASALAGIFLS
jgi:hypothetical protein